MAYRLKSQETLDDGVKRIVKEQIDRALEQLLDEFERDRDEAIHDARKRFKKVRAVLRLIRYELGEAPYKQENAYFRDTGKQLSHVRDAKVRIETLDDLQEHFHNLADVQIFDDVRQALEAYYASTWEYLLGTQEAIATTIQTLKDARERIDTWSIERNDWSAIEGGFKKIYKQGYKGWHRLSEAPTAENYHDWRKRVKYLWYHLSIMRPIWRKIIKEWADQVHHLASLLGTEHDLSVLRDFVLSEPKRLQDVSGLDVLIPLIDRRRDQLRSRAGFLGRRIYAEEPKAFTQRLSTYWETWQLEQDAVT
ncbi:MAG TPA: CHAD domain-containing protein [Elainellaceae cyanobacterium]